MCEVAGNHCFTLLSFSLFRSPSFFRRTLSPFPTRYEAMNGCHAVAVLTEWSQFRDYDYNKVCIECPVSSSVLYAVPYIKCLDRHLYLYHINAAPLALVPYHSYRQHTRTPSLTSAPAWSLLQNKVYATMPKPAYIFDGQFRLYIKHCPAGVYFSSRILIVHCSPGDAHQQCPVEVDSERRPPFLLTCAFQFDDVTVSSLSIDRSVDP